MSTKNILGLVGAVAGAYYVGGKTDSGLGAVVGAVAGAYAGSAIGQSVDDGSLAREVNRLQLQEEKARLEHRLSALEYDENYS